MKKENNLFLIEDLLEKTNLDFDLVSAQKSKFEFLYDFSKKNDFDLFFDSKSYLIVDEKLNLAQDFVIKDSERKINSSYSSKEKFHDFYFDFFFNLDFLEDKIPIFIHFRDFLEDKNKIIYSKSLKYGLMNFKNYKDLKYRREGVTHPKPIKEILNFYSKKGLEKNLLKKVKETLIDFRGDHPVFTGKKVRYARKNIIIFDRGGWTACSNCGEDLGLGSGSSCKYCESVFEGSSTRFI